MQKGKFKVAYVQLSRDERFYIEKHLSCDEYVSKPGLAGLIRDFMCVDYGKIQGNTTVC